MNVQNLRKLLEQTDNKLSIFANIEILNKYDFNVNEFYNLISDFLTDVEKLKLFDYPHIIKLENWMKSGIVGLVTDENIILQMLNNDNIADEFESYQIVDIMKKMSDTLIQQLLYDDEFIKKRQITAIYVKDIISSLTDNLREKILMDKDLITNKLHLDDVKITELTKSLQNNNYKFRILEEYNFDKKLKVDILRTLDVETLGIFLDEQKELCRKNKIKPYEIVLGLDKNSQKEFVEKLENINLTQNEKKEILATLNKDVKQSIDTTNLSEEYKLALSIKTTEDDGNIIVDFKRDLEDYRGLDNLISINPEKFTKEQRDNFIELCDICPNLQVISTIYNTVKYNSTASEYKEAEKWINSVIENINPEYSKAQKMAIIDNAIGKKISYSPDFDTEVFNKSNSRALWKIISSGYGVCNGIAKVEQYMLNRVGIESEIVGSENHAFLKIKDIELPFSNGEIVKGNTILDPTWNLTAHRFNGKPDNFCISYEQARKNDKDIDDNDHNCHKNDEKLQDATINLDEQSLRKLFASVGLADKEGKFPIQDLQEKSKILDEIFANQPEQNINKQFLLLSKTSPEFATCQNSSMNILSDILLDNENLRFNRCVVNRVYNKEDKDKRPVLYVYIDSDELGEKFYYANKDNRKFIELQHEEFTKKFECYDEDLENLNGVKPWESKVQEKANIDLSRNSGKIVAREGQER